MSYQSITTCTKRKFHVLSKSHFQIDLVYFTARMSHTSDTNVIRVWHERHKVDTSKTRATRVRHDHYTNDTSATWVLHKRHECDTSATRVKNFDFDNDTSENIFSHPRISYMANEILQGEESPFRNASFRCQNAFEKCTTKTELCNGKRYIKKLYTRL